MSFSHLLFPVLSRAEGKDELKGVARLASSLAARLTLLRVVDPFREGGPRPAGEEAASMDTDAHGIDNNRFHIDSHSDPAASIVQFAAKQNIDGIVFPPQRYKWFPEVVRRKEMLRRLSGESKCPIWLMAGAEEEPPKEIRRILCAVSGRDHKVLETAAALSERVGARLFVLHVVPEIHEGTLSYGFDQHVALSAENGLKLLAGMQRQCGTDGQPIVDIGDKNKCISKAARTLRAELVVTGRRHKLKAAPFWSFGRASSAVAPRVPCESLVV